MRGNNVKFNPKQHEKNILTKEQFRTYIKSKMKARFCIYDKLCVKKIYTCIINYTKPKTYKIKHKKKLSYIKANTHKYNILFYLPLPNEVDLIHIIYKLRKCKKYQVFVPKLEKISFNMVKCRFPLVKNYCRIYEPKTCNIYKDIIIDIAIVPVLGVDKNMKRIGFGKGMYDRFYSTLKVRPYSIFTSRFQNIAVQPLCQWYDIQADKYVSTYK